MNGELAVFGGREVSRLHETGDLEVVLFVCVVAGGRKMSSTRVRKVSFQATHRSVRSEPEARCAIGGADVGWGRSLGRGWSIEHYWFPSWHYVVNPSPDRIVQRLREWSRKTLKGRSRGTSQTAFIPLTMSSASMIFQDIRTGLLGNCKQAFGTIKHTLKTTDYVIRKTHSTEGVTSIRESI